MAQNKKRYLVVDEVGKVMTSHDSLKEAQEESYGDCTILEVTKQLNVDYEKVFEEEEVGKGLC